MKNIILAVLTCLPISALADNVAATATYASAEAQYLQHPSSIGRVGQLSGNYICDALMSDGTSSRGSENLLIRNLSQCDRPKQKSLEIFYPATDGSPVIKGKIYFRQGAAQTQVGQISWNLRSDGTQLLIEFKSQAQGVFGYYRCDRSTGAPIFDVPRCESPDEQGGVRINENSGNRDAQSQDSDGTPTIKMGGVPVGRDGYTYTDSDGRQIPGHNLQRNPYADGGAYLDQQRGHTYSPDDEGNLQPSVDNLIAHKDCVRRANEDGHGARADCD